MHVKNTQKQWICRMRKLCRKQICHRKMSRWKDSPWLHRQNKGWKVGRGRILFSFLFPSFLVPLSLSSFPSPSLPSPFFPLPLSILLISFSPLFLILSDGALSAHHAISITCKPTSPIVRLATRNAAFPESRNQRVKAAALTNDLSPHFDRYTSS